MIIGDDTPQEAGQFGLWNQIYSFGDRINIPGSFFKQISDLRANGVKLLRKQAANEISKIEKRMEALVGLLDGVKALLIIDVLRKADEAERVLLNNTQEKEALKINMYARGIISDSKFNSLERIYSVLKSSESLNLILKIRPLAEAFFTRSANRKPFNAELLEFLLKVVAELREAIKATREKVRTLTITTEIVVSIGGDASAATNETAAYDPGSQKWTPASEMRHKRSLTAATSWNGTVVVAGGCTEQCTWDKTVEEYNPVNNSWLELNSLLVGRNDLALVTLNGRIYALGGWTMTGATNSVETLDNDNNQANWNQAEPMTKARSAFAAVALHVRLNHTQYT